MFRRVTYKKLRRILNIALRTLPVIIFIQSIFCVGGAGILRDMEGILPEMQELERRGLLSSPPAAASRLVKREIGLVHNSKGLEDYIEYNRQMLRDHVRTWWVWVALFPLLLLLRIYFRKSKFPDQKEFLWGMRAGRD